MTPSNLIASARDLLVAERGRPRQANLSRAMSAAYYAMFHCLAGCCADALVGASGSSRSEPAWLQVYRSLEHGTARRRCQQVSRLERFSVETRNFADLFVDLQEKRHKADYDPSSSFPKLIVEGDIVKAEQAIANFRKVSLSERRAFAVYVLLAVRSR